MSDFGRLIGAIDEGTSSARFMLFRIATGEVVTFHQETLDQICPQEGWVEQDPMEIIRVVEVCIEKAIENLLSLGGNVKDIVAVGVTNQRESTIVWDPATGTPFHNSLVWLDMRTSSTVDNLLDQVPNKTRNKNYLRPLCGLPLSPYFSGVKLRWLKENIATVNRAMTEGNCLFGTVDTWLLWNLTGGQNGGIHVTDVTNASRTMLMNLETLDWDPMLLNFFAIPESILPEIRSNSELFGYFSKGPLKGVPISGCIGDQQAALIGQQCFSRGEAKVTYGTGCFLLFNSGYCKVDSSHGLLTTVGYKFGKEAHTVYALEGSIAVGGAAMTWLRDNIDILPNIKDAEQIAKTVTDNDVYFVPAFSGLYAPYWQQEARGVICGITEDTSTEHIIRAAIEAVCYQTRDILEAMNKDCGFNLTKLKVDGGMTVNKLMLQLLADTMGIPVIRPEMAETTALGAALVAGIGIGLINVSDATSLPLAKKQFESKCTEDERDLRYSKWKKAIERSMGWDVL